MIDRMFLFLVKKGGIKSRKSLYYFHTLNPILNFTLEIKGQKEGYDKSRNINHVPCFYLLCIPILRTMNVVLLKSNRKVGWNYSIRGSLSDVGL